ncbi:MAG: YicC family protein [Verrucomicrobiae bacterium]|nr:YicC family protein [Verrucomicrobiae bacterium]
MRSMTGHGRGERSLDGLKLIVEVNSFNRKLPDVSVKLPPALDGLEPRIRDEVNARISRGRITVVVALQPVSPSGQVRLDTPLARAYLRAFQKLRHELKLPGPITLETVLRAPGVLKPAEANLSPDAAWPAVQTALRRALTTMIKMRQKEGKHLAADINCRLRRLSKSLSIIRRVAPKMLRRYREQLCARIRNAGLEIPASDERIAKELVLYADRCDITEELTRLDSHLRQFRVLLKSNEAVGRTLDFLVQEMNREVNTIGAKANAAEISHQVVSMKAELEKIREQVQNIE